MMMMMMIVSGEEAEQGTGVRGRRRGDGYGLE